MARASIAYTQTIQALEQYQGSLEQGHPDPDAQADLQAQAQLAANRCQAASDAVLEVESLCTEFRPHVGAGGPVCGDAGGSGQAFGGIPKKHGFGTIVRSKPERRQREYRPFDLQTPAETSRRIWRSINHRQVTILACCVMPCEADFPPPQWADDLQKGRQLPEWADTLEAMRLAVWSVRSRARIWMR